MINKSIISIEMNNYEPGSLYMHYEGNVPRPERYDAWLKFFHTIYTRGNPEKSKHIILNHESLHEMQKARWFVSFALR